MQNATSPIQITRKQYDSFDVFLRRLFADQNRNAGQQVYRWDIFYRDTTFFKLQYLSGSSWHEIVLTAGMNDKGLYWIDDLFGDVLYDDDVFEQIENVVSRTSTWL